MPVCSRCHKDWPEQYWVCPEDGTVLTASRSVAGGSSPGTPIGIPREEDLQPGTMIGEYCVEGKLGEGGMATVFAATHPLIGKKVAIKVISRRLCADQHAVERFINEARTVNQIGHPNLVDIFAFGVLPDGRAYLVMEWLQGETLADRLQRERPSLPRALDIFIQLVDALEAAHEKGIVHRDLKPHNVFILERKDAVRVKLLDFGIAKLADSDASVPKTRSGVAMGTAGYMSPEQARGKNVDHRTDIYALGCVAWEMLLGQLPFVADTAIDILAMHLAAAPPSPRALWPSVPAGVEKMLLQMLAKEPDGRPSLPQIRAVFDSTFRALTPSRGVPPRANTPPQRRWPLFVAAATAGSIIIGTGIYAYVTTRAQVITLPPPSRVAADKEKSATAAPAAATATATAPASAETQPAARSTLVVYAPAGARVDVDGDARTSRGAPLKIDVAGGEHHVVVTQPRRQPYDERVRVAAGATAEVRAKLQRLQKGAPKGADTVPSAAPGVKATAPAQAGEAKAADVKALDGKQPEAKQPEAKQPDGKQPEAKQPDGKPVKKTGDYTLDPF